MLAEQLRRGALVSGRRVVGMMPGHVNHRRTVTVTFDDGTRARYTIGRPVPGTGPRTDLPAGPVGAGRGARSTGAGRFDSESAGDRHSRLIDRLIYG